MCCLPRSRLQQSIDETGNHIAISCKSHRQADANFMNIIQRECSHRAMLVASSCNPKCKSDHILPSVPRDLKSSYQPESSRCPAYLLLFCCSNNVGRLQARLPSTLTTCLEALASEYEADLELSHTQQEGGRLPDFPALPMQEAVQAAIEVFMKWNSPPVAPFSPCCPDQNTPINPLLLQCIVPDACLRYAAV